MWANVGQKVPTLRFHGTIVLSLFALTSTVGCVQHHLANGLHLILLPSSSAKVVAIQAWVAVGSADETESQAGLSHVMEHMLFKGTKTRGVGQIAKDVESAGGEINAWTSRDNTVFHVVMPSRYAEVGLDVLSDALIHSSFDALELKRELEVILEEIRQGRDEPMRMLAQRMFATTFEKHPYRKPVIGTEENVAKFRRSDLVRFRDHWYRGSSVSLIVSGDFDPDDMKALVQKRFASLPSGKARRKRRAVESSSDRQSSQLQTADVSQSQMALAFRLPTVRDPACAAMDVLTVILGQGESSNMNRDLVRKQELCKSAYSYLHALQDTSLAIVGAVTEPGKLLKSLPAIGRKIQELRDEKVTRSSMESAQKAIEADAIFQRETAEGIAHVAGSYLALAKDPDFERSYLRSVAAVELDDLHDVAREVLRPERMNLSLLVPQSKKLASEESQQRAAQKMLALVEKGMQSSRGKPAAVKRKTGKTTKVKPANPLLDTRLSNGVRVLIQVDASVPIIAARAVWSGGQLLETPSTSGIGELMSSVITRGCARRSTEEIIEDVDGQASSLVGFTGRNSFGIRAEWLTHNWQQGFDLLSDCLLSPRFDEVEVERSKRRQLARIATQKDSPSYRAFSLFQQTLYRKHPYRFHSSGTSSSVAPLSSAKLKRFYKKHYPISALTMAFVGDIDTPKLLARLEARFGSEKTTSRPVRKPITEVFVGRSTASREVYDTMQREQSQLVIGFPGIDIRDEDRFALEVLTNVLGGQGGRLFLQLRDRQSLAYQIGAFSLEGLDPGYVAFYLSCSPDKIDEAIAGVQEQINAIKRKGISSLELANSKRHLTGTHEIALQRRSAVAAALAFHHAYGLPYSEHVNYAKSIQRVKAGQVKAVANRLLDWDQAITVTVAPPLASPEAQKRMNGVVKKTKRKKGSGKKRGRQ